LAEPELPTTWREAVPYVIWIVLVLGFGLEFTTNLIHSNWPLAIWSFGSMAGLVAVMLHWRQLRSWATTINPNWVVGCLLSLLLIIALLPFVEQKRYPFSIWFEDNPATEAHQATLIAWLQQAQQERDRAAREREQEIISIQRDREAALNEARTVQAQLSAMQRNIAEDQTQTQAQASRPAILDETAKMAANDKERLANAFYDISQLLDRGRKLMGESGGLAHGGIADIGRNDLPRLISVVDSLIADSKQFSDDMSHLQEKWKYYSRQIGYIIGDDSDNHALLAQNALAEVKNYVASWGNIANSRDVDVAKLLYYPQRDFGNSMTRFGEWLNECSNRLSTMRSAIQ
jgi:hypothetical protein